MTSFCVSLLMQLNCGVGNFKAWQDQRVMLKTRLLGQITELLARGA